MLSQVGCEEGLVTVLGKVSWATCFAGFFSLAVLAIYA